MVFVQGNFLRELTSFSWCTPTIETAHPVNTGGPIETSCPCTIIDVHRTVRPCPPVDADAGEAAHTVGAGSAVLAHRRTQRTFVHVLLTESSRVRGGTLARVTVDAVDARGAVLALMARTVVNVLLAILTTKT